MFADRFSTVIARNVDLLHNRFVDISWITGIIIGSPVHKHGPGFKEFPVTGYPGLGSILGIYQFTGHIMDANPAHCLNITCDQERINQRTVTDVGVRGAFNNYVDRIWPFFDISPPWRGQFLYPEPGQKQTFLTHSPLILSTYLLNAP